ncbi:MAG: NAD-dependent epimerase/dehydratase family protein [Caldilineae bacterium]|nr:MAG: NAD-dependent epimerase/dehydratase family protein [Caldilineae bacterium]
MTSTPPVRCLVTGGCGFIGSHLVSLLAEQGHEVLVYDRTPPPADLQTLPNVRFRQGELIPLLQRPDSLRGIQVVFHLAWAHEPESATRHPVGDIEANLVMTVRLLQACVEQGVRRIVFSSTGGAIYGPVRSLPVSEDHPTRPISAYGVTKLAAEKYIQLYHHLHGLEHIILRPSVCYGPRQNPFGRQGAVAVFIGRILSGHPIVIFGDGDTIVRDFFHVRDLAHAFLAAMHASADRAIINVGGGVGITLNQILHHLSQVADSRYPISVQSAPPRPFDVPRLVLDISRARRLLGWQPRITLEEGLAQTWAWYEKTWPDHAAH